MARNPLVEIRSALIEVLETDFPPLSKRETTLGFDFTFPGVREIDLSADIIWTRKSDVVDLYLSQESAAFSPWHMRDMLMLFIELSESIKPHLEEIVPECDELDGVLTPAHHNGESRVLIPMYHGIIPCMRYSDKRIGKLLIRHLYAGAKSLVFGQDVFAALAQGRHDVDIGQSVAHMVQGEAVVPAAKPASTGHVFN